MTTSTFAAAVTASLFVSQQITGSFHAKNICHRTRVHDSKQLLPRSGVPRAHNTIAPTTEQRRSHGGQGQTIDWSIMAAFDFIHGIGGRRIVWVARRGSSGGGGGGGGGKGRGQPTNAVAKRGRETVVAATAAGGGKATGCRFVSVRSHGTKFYDIDGTVSPTHVQTALFVVTGQAIDKRGKCN